MKRQEQKAYQGIADELRIEMNPTSIVTNGKHTPKDTYNQVKAVKADFRIGTANAAYALGSIHAEDIGFAYFLHKVIRIEFDQAVDRVADLSYTTSEASAYRKIADFAKATKRNLRKVIDDGMEVSQLEWLSIEGDTSLNGHREINMSSLHVVLEPRQLHELRNSLYSSSKSLETLEDNISAREKVA